MPDIKLVSNRPDEEIEKQHATGALKRTLVNLASNLMRVVRGAGKAFHKRPADEPVFHQVPNSEQPGPDLPEIRSLNDDAICTAALEVVASSLIGQEREHGNAVNDLRRLLDTEHQRAQRLAAKSKSQKSGRYDCCSILARVGPGEKRLLT